MPSPRLCPDEDGVLPMELVEKEKKRLKTVLTSVCKARLKEVIAFYRALYEERMFMGRVYPGVFPLLEALRGAGVRTSLATMKRQPGALELEST